MCRTTVPVAMLINIVWNFWSGHRLGKIEDQFGRKKGKGFEGC